MRGEEPECLSSLPGLRQVADAGSDLFFPASCPLPPHKKSPEFRSQTGGFIDNGAVEFWARTYGTALRIQAHVKPRGLCLGDLSSLITELSSISFSSN